MNMKAILSSRANKASKKFRDFEPCGIRALLYQLS